MYKYFLLLLMPLVLMAFKNEEKSSRSSSAQANVTVPEQTFKMNGLGRERQIRIYLPKDYQESDQKYPVLYMHDGQNLFDDSTSYAGEWGVDESLNQLAEESGFKLIVVGIDNGQEKRMNELSPWENKKFGKAEGEEYMEFIVNQVKPFIDNAYRTLPDRENTAIMGSSMGGLISHYAIYKYPEVFGKAGLLSCSYWFSDAVYDYTLSNPVPKDSRLFLVIGKKERGMVGASKKMKKYILQSGHPKENLSFFIDPKGNHSEGAWRKQFVPVVRWLFLQ